MNRFQKIVLYGAVLNVLVLFLFPPYDVMSFGRGAQMFDAFYPMFAVPANRVINGDVLYLLTFAVLLNAALAWLLKHPARIQPVVGSTDPAAIRSSAKACEVVMSREQWYQIYTVARGTPLP